MATVSRDNILQLLKDRGPMVPNDIKKVLGGDTIILGAMLAELSSRKLVSITHAKRGGSPFYYIPENLELLEQCFRYLSDQEQSIINILKTERVIQDNKLEVYQRVALRQLKDFAKEFKANTTNGEILFWRYFLVTDDEAVTILNERHAPKEPEPSPQKTIQEAVVEPEPETVIQETFSEPVVDDHEQSERETEKVSIQEVDEVEEALETIPVLEAEPEPEPVVHKEPETISEPEPKPEPKPKPKPLITKEELEPVIEKEDSQDALVITEPSLEETPFYLHILKFFDEHDIRMLKEEQLSKGKEYEFIIRVSTAVGNVNMLARAKNKKRLNESDVAPALLRAKNKDLFCLYLTPGEFTKKSQELITKEYTGLIQKQMSEFSE